MNRLQLVVMVLVLGTVGCGPVAMLKKPEGYAQYQEALPHFKVISATGVRLQARDVPNDPKADVGLWTESVQLFLKSQGYQIINVSDVPVKDGQPGKRILALYRYHERDFAYLVALFVREDRVFLVEGGGPFQEYQADQARVEATLRTFAIR